MNSSSSSFHDHIDEYAAASFRYYMMSGVSPGECKTSTAAPISNTDTTTTSSSSSASEDDISHRLNLLLSVGEECQTEAELRQLLQKKKTGLRCYDGFEPSGRMHIAQGIFKACNVNKCLDAGCTFVFWVADWFALMNDKMGGRLDAIRTVGEYFTEVWKISGMNVSSGNVEFIWSSEQINARAEEYWAGYVLDIARKSSLSRVMKCGQIMGRKDGSLSAAQILYPLMQCADIFFLKADICQLGVDQRKVNMLAREYCDQIGRKLKPIVLSHHMLQGLLEQRDEDGALLKMSKSSPDSAIFMEDTRDEIARKIHQAYCPMKEEKENPCLEYVKYIVYGAARKLFTYATYEEFLCAYVSGVHSEKDVKDALITQIDEMISPVRTHFETDAKAKDLLAKVIQYRSAAAAPDTKQEQEQAVIAPADTSHYIAWLYPSMSIPFRDALGLVRTLNAVAAEGKKKVTLILADWSAFTANSLGPAAELKDIRLVLQYNVDLLRSLGLDTSSPSINIVLQSEKILKDPNTYWITVIHAGRKISVAELTAATTALHHSGQVVAALMQIADAIVFEGTDFLVKYIGGCCPVPLVHTLFKKCPMLAKQDVHFHDAFDVRCELLPVCLSEVAVATATITTEVSNTLATENTLLLTDTEADIKKKIKRAFGPPNVLVGNPLLPLAEFCIQERRTWCVSRPAEHGGDVAYTEIQAVQNDYEKGTLHPGDVKTALVPIFLDVTKSLRAFLEGAEMKKKYTLALKNLAKKQQNSK